MSPAVNLGFHFRNDIQLTEVSGMAVGTLRKSPFESVVSTPQARPSPRKSLP